MAAQTATAAMAARLAECEATTSSADYLACFVLYANEYEHILQQALSDEIGLAKHIDLMETLNDRLEALPVPRAAQAMHNAFRMVTLNDSLRLLSLMMGDYGGANYYVSVHGLYWGDYIYLREAYLDSIGKTVRGAGFDR